MLKIYPLWLLAGNIKKKVFLILNFMESFINLFSS